MSREHTDTTEDDALEALLLHVGARDEPSSAAMEEVRKAVHAEWRAALLQRQRQRRTLTFRVAASVAIVVIVATWALRFAAPTASAEMTVALIDGRAWLAASQGQPQRALKVGDSIGVGAALSTDDGTRLALEYGAGASVRVDRNSSIERVAVDRVLLSKGAIYVDAHRRLADDPLVIETSLGDVRHLGTQYQVRQSPGGLLVGIREGRVEIAHANGTAFASAGQRLRITSGGLIQRTAISGQDPDWDWAEATVPAFEIHDRTLAEFLEWAARETGRRVSYGSDEAQRAAEALRLRGSIDGLTPETALSAVLSTTSFTRRWSREDLIDVRLDGSGDSPTRK